MSEITKLEPKALWEIFDSITKVPRPSKREAKIIAFLEDFARNHKLEYKKDGAGNILIIKDATPTMQDRPTVVLQSHMDMVCEKNSDVEFDFDSDPIQTYVSDGWVRARGTTLGADDGIGMATALAVVTDDSLEHPRIEALFTVDEETGLTGAFELGKDMLTGHYLINLDSEDDGEIFIGCAGGIDTVATFSYSTEPAPVGMEWFKLTLSGLKGGHSGDNINDGLGNSNKLMSRVLLEATPGLRLSLFDGGNLRNAIPREAYAVVGIPAAEVEKFKEKVAWFAHVFQSSFHDTDPDVKLEITPADTPSSVIDLNTQNNLLSSIHGVINGVIAMSKTIDDLVETSTNLASVKFTDDNHIVVTSSQRSSVESAKHNAAAVVGETFERAGAKVEHSDGYPGWEPNTSSRLLKVAEETYSKLFGDKAKVKAIHAGLECGLFLEKYPDLEMISVGPTLRGVHSPEERLEIATVDKFWMWITEILRNI